MKGFITYLTYNIIEEEACVCLFGRLENGESFLTINKYRPYFFIKEKDLKKALKIDSFEYEKTNFNNFNNETVVKVILDVPSSVPNLRKKLEEENMECYEADIKFPYRFLIDKGIKGSLDIDGYYENREHVDRVYKEPDLKPADFIPKLKVASIDIETNSESADLYCISIYADNFKEAFIISKEKLKNAINCKDEEDLLEKFKEKILELDPDIITGWNLIDFDLVILEKKFKQYGIEFKLGRDNSKCKLKIENSFVISSRADFPGRMVLDGLLLLRNSFIKLQDYKLDTAAGIFLKDKKLIREKDRHNEIDRMYKEDKQKLVDYNLKDSELVYRILYESKVLELTIQRSLLTGMPLDRVSASIASLDSLYIREARKRKIVVPTGKYNIKEKPILGGFVRESEPGIYDYILVLDFKSLYPSLIRTFNIDPYSYVKDCKEKNLIKAPNGACFRNEEGILSTVIQKLWEAREKTRKDKNELARYAIKIHMNSIFGSMASPSCRFFNLDIGNAITHFGQFIIKNTEKKFNEFGYKVIYQDTDGSFILSNARNIEEADKIGKKLQEEVNNYYDIYVRKNYSRESFLELSYDKCFVKFLMPKIRGSEKGAKKKYAGLVIKDGKEDIQITGLEAVRGDWTGLAKKFQNELLNKIFHNKEVSDYITNFINDLKNGKYDNLLIYRKKLKKNIEDYAVKAQHKKVADIIIKHKGKLESNVIEYVMTGEGPEPLEFKKGEIDYDYYIKKQLVPIIEQVAPFYNINIELLKKKADQTSLDSF